MVGFVPVPVRGWEEQEWEEFFLQLLSIVAGEAVAGESLKVGCHRYGRSYCLAREFEHEFGEGALQLVILQRQEQMLRFQVRLLRQTGLREAGRPVPICEFRIWSG